MPITADSSPGPIVVGVERSARSRDALALGRMLARAAGTRLILVAVYPLDARSARMDRGAYATALAEEAEATLEWAGRPLSGVLATTRAIPCTSVARGLQQLAEDEGALAIVVGPSHRGGLGRVVPGSVGERLLHGAPCPVAVAPRGYWGVAHAAIRQIGLAYVNTPEAAEALAAAVGLATRTGAAIRARSVVQPAPVGATGPFDWSYTELEETTRDAVVRSLRRAVGDVDAPVEISAEVVDGYADDELARLSDEVDVLICGSRGHGPVGRVVLSSVAAGVMRKARGPVLVVPRGAQDGFAALLAPTTVAA
ncbi:MAG TPA: universal stress protein [Solirubrobacteraceae bacterium]|nr:universal stress protein [Solirubrobacteraceae bacterium]